MARVVILNAAPRAGKDHAAKFLTNMINHSDDTNTAVHREMKKTLFALSAATVGVDLKDFMYGYDEPSNLSKTGWFKDYPMYPVGGKVLSKREVLIHVSENVIKPFFGKDAFGQIEANKVGEETYVFYSDGGFPDEIKPLCDTVGADNVLVIRIHKEGCTFEGDSRSYLEPSMFDSGTCPEFADITNVHGEVDQFENELLEIIMWWEGILAYKAK